MRMIICANCNSAIIASEQEEIETCKCGECKLMFEKGKYFYSGEEVLAIGLDDASMLKAIRQSGELDRNIDFSAWIPKITDPHFYKLPKI